MEPDVMKIPTNYPSPQNNGRSDKLSYSTRKVRREQGYTPE